MSTTPFVARRITFKSLKRGRYRVQINSVPAEKDGRPWIVSRRSVKTVRRSAANQGHRPPSRQQRVTRPWWHF